MNDQQLASTLVRQQMVSREAIQQAIARRRPEQSLAEVLLDMGAVTEETLRLANSDTPPSAIAANSGAEERMAISPRHATAQPAQGEEAATVRIVDAVLSEGVAQGASDIHVEPREAGFFLRYRLDGVLRDPVALDQSKQSAITSRLKVYERPRALLIVV